jgi:hypothetical protein
MEWENRMSFGVKHLKRGTVPKLAPLLNSNQRTVLSIAGLSVVFTFGMFVVLFMH